MTLAGTEKSGTKEQKWENENVDITGSGLIGEDLVVQVKLRPDEKEMQFILFRGDVPMPSDRYQIQTRGNIVQLTLKQSQKDDSGHYALVAKKLSTGLSIPDDERLESRHKIRLSIQDPSSILDEAEPPIFLRRLSDLAVKVGTRTRFLVEIRSSTSPKVTWHKNDEPVQSGARMSFVHEGNFYCVDVAPVMVDDQGHWTCMAENGGGRSSCTCFLSVIVPKAYKKPEFVEELRALLTETGTVSLECKVVGVPTPVLKWFKDRKEIKAGDVFALTANPDDPTSLGTYTCEAVNCMGTACSSSRVHVMGKGSREGSLKPADALTPSGPFPVFEKILRDESCRIGESLVLSCQVQVPPWPKIITWYNKEGKVEPSEKYHVKEDGLGGYSIEIKGVEAMDEGEWKCVATSSENMKQFSTCHVAMSIPKNYRMPRFMESLKAVLTEEGLVSFECKVVGFPTPLLRWFKDGQELHPGDVYQLTGTNSLGSYCCIAKNCMGEAKSIAELTVEDIQNQLNEEERLQLMSSNQAPKFVKGLRSCEARINEDFTFTIQVSVSPEPILSWYRDDVAIIESEKYRLAKESLGVCNLEVKKLEFMDQAEWKCVAANDFGHSVTSCFLKLVIPKHFKKPKFLESLRAILSEEGAVNLECKVIGVPQPILKWYKDNVELKPGDIHRIISGQDGTCCLGTYTCEATNCMGSVSSSASLLGFEDHRVSVRKEEAKEPATPLHELARNLSLSTIHEERTSQLYDTPQTDHSITMDDRGEVSFSFDGKEVSVSLYETPDLTEEEALQIVEMYADQLSEHITEGNIIELPPMRFMKETSTTGNLLMEAVVIDVSLDYFIPDEEGDDLRTEADVEDVSIMDDQMQSIRSLSYVSSPGAETSGSAPSRPPRRKESRESFSSRSERSEKSLPKGFDWSDSYHSAKEPSLQAQSFQGQDDSGEAFTDALSSSGAGRSKIEDPKDICASLIEQNIEKIPLDDATIEMIERQARDDERIATKIEEARIEELPVKRKRKKKRDKQSGKGSRTPSVSSKASSEDSYSVEGVEEKEGKRLKKGEKDRRGSDRSDSESGRFESAASTDLRRRESDATIMVDELKIERIGEIDSIKTKNGIQEARSKDDKEIEEPSAISQTSNVDSEKSISKTNKERLLDSVYKLSEPVIDLRSALVDFDDLLSLLQSHESLIDLEKSKNQITERIVLPIENLYHQVSEIETKALKSAGDRSLAQNVRISLLEAIGGPTEELLRGIELMRRQSGQEDPKSNLIVLESLTDPVDEILVGLTRIEQHLKSQDGAESPLIEIKKPIAFERISRAVLRLGKSVGNITERKIPFGDESTKCSVIERLQSVYQSLEAFLSTVPLSEISGTLENNVDTLVVETLVRPLEQLAKNLDIFATATVETRTDQDAVVESLTKSMIDMRTKLEALTLALETYERESGEHGITELHDDLVKFLTYTMDDGVERLEKLKEKKVRVIAASSTDSPVESSDLEERSSSQEFRESVSMTKDGSVDPEVMKSEPEFLADVDGQFSRVIEKESGLIEHEKMDPGEERPSEECYNVEETIAKLPELDRGLSLPEMLLDPLIDVQANLNEVISNFESQESAAESSSVEGSELAACLTELRECVATAAHTATTLKSAKIIDSLVDLREPLLDLQLAMASAVSPEEVRLIQEAMIPLSELKVIVEAAISSPQTTEPSRIQMRSVLRMVDEIEAEVAKPCQEIVKTIPENLEKAEVKKMAMRPPEEVERAAVALTGVHFAISSALERAASFSTDFEDPSCSQNEKSSKQKAEESGATNLINGIEGLRQSVGDLAIAIGSPLISKGSEDRYDYEVLFDEFSKLEEPLMNLQKVLLTEQHGPEDRHILNDLATPIRSLKEVLQDVTREITGGTNLTVLELIEDVEKDVTLIAMEALKKALAAKSEASDDDGRTSVSSTSKPGEVSIIIAKWLDPVEDWLTSVSQENTELEETPASAIAAAVDDLKRELLKIAIQTSYSEPPSDVALIESLTELQEPLTKVYRVLAASHEPESLDIVEGLKQPMKHLLGTVLDASYVHEAGKLLRPVLEAIEEVENQIPLTIKRANYERELQRVVRSMTPEETARLEHRNILEDEPQPGTSGDSRLQNFIPTISTDEEIRSDISLEKAEMQEKPEEIDLYSEKSVIAESQAENLDQEKYQMKVEESGERIKPNILQKESQDSIPSGGEKSAETKESLSTEELGKKTEGEEKGDAGTGTKEVTSASVEEKLKKDDTEVPSGPEVSKSEETSEKPLESPNYQSETVEVITVDNRPFPAATIPMESGQTAKTSESDTTRADELDLWSLTLLGPLDRLGSAVLSLDRSIDEMAHGLLCRPLDSLHKQIEIAESQFNRPSGHSLENDVETIIEGFLSPVNQLHSALSAAVDVWNDEQPRIVVRDLLRSIADSSSELCELLATLRKKLIVQKVNQTLQAQQEDVSLVETINAVIAPLEDVKNLIEEALNNLEFVDSNEKLKIKDLQITEEKRADVIRKNEEFVSESLKEEATVSVALENIESVKEVIEESEKASIFKAEVVSPPRKESKVKEDSMDIEETTAKPLEELIEAIVDSSGRHVSSSPEASQLMSSRVYEDEAAPNIIPTEEIISDKSEEVLGEIPKEGKEKVSGIPEVARKTEIDENARKAVTEILAKATSIAEISTIENKSATEAEIIEGDIAEEIMPEMGADDFPGRALSSTTAENLAKAEAKKEQVLKIAGTALPEENVVESVVDVETEKLEQEKARVSQTGSLDTASVMEGPEIKSKARGAEVSEVEPEEAEESLVAISAAKVDKEKAELRQSEQLDEAKVLELPEIEIKARTAESSELKTEDAEEKLVSLSEEKIHPGKAELGQSENLSEIEITDTPEVKIKPKDAELSELETEAGEEISFAISGEKIDPQKAELREDDNLKKAKVAAIPEVQLKARDAELSELEPEASAENVTAISGETMDQQKAELREGENLEKAQIIDAPEIKIKARDAELSEFESEVSEENSAAISGETMDQQKADIREGEILEKAEIIDAPEIKIKARDAELSEFEPEASQEILPAISGEKIDQQKADLRQEENLDKAKITDAPDIKIKTMEAELSESVPEVVENIDAGTSSNKVEKQKAAIIEEENLSKPSVDAPKTRRAEKIESLEEMMEESKEMSMEKLATREAEISTEDHLHMAKIAKMAETKLAKLTKEDIIETSDSSIVEIVETPTQKIFKIKKEGSKVDEPEEIVEKMIIKPVEEVVAMEDQKIVEIVETPSEKIIKMKIAIEGRDGVMDEIIEEIVLKKPVEGWAKSVIEEEASASSVSQEKIQAFAAANISQDLEVSKEKEETLDEIGEAISLREEKDEVRMKEKGETEVKVEKLERLKKEPEGEETKMERQETMKGKEKEAKPEGAENIRREEEGQLRKEEVEELDRKYLELQTEAKTSKEHLRKEEEEKLREEEAKRLEKEKQEAEGIRKEEEEEEEKLQKEKRQREKKEEEERLQREKEETVRKEEAARIEKEEREKQERAKIEAEELRQEEAERIKKEEAEKEEMERKEKEAERIKKEEAEKEEMERKEKEAERIKKEEAEKLEREELKRLEEEQRLEREKELERVKTEEEERLKKEEAERLEKEKEELERARKEKEEAGRLETERLEREKKEEEERLEKEKAEKIRQEELDRKKQEEARAKKEEERVEKEKAEKIQQEERERKKEEEERAKKEEEERLEKEKAEKIRQEELERKQQEEAKKKREEEERARKEEEERLEIEKAEKIQQEELERKKQEEERAKKEEEERLEKEKAEKIRQEELERRKLEEERVKKEEEERLEKEKAEKIRQEELERKQKEEAKKKQEEEVRARKEEEGRLEKEKAEKIRQEELERKKQEEERAKKEEEERLEKEKAEKIRQEELERKKQEEEEAKKKREEEERARKEEEERLEKEKAEKIRQEELERKKQEEEEAKKKREDEECAKKEEAERLEKEKAEKIRQEELERKKQEEEARKKREEEERARKEEEERLEKEEAEKIRQEELARKKQEEEAKKKREEEERARKEEEERLEKEKAEKIRQEELKRKQQEEEAKKKREEEELAKKTEAERLEKEKAEKIRQEELERKKQEEEARKKREEEERAKKEEEERLEKEKAEKIRQEELERKKQEEEEARRKREEEERVKKGEEDRLKKEKAEQIKEEELKQKQQEEEKKKREEEERVKKEEHERLEKEKAEKIRQEELQRKKKEEEERKKPEEQDRAKKEKEQLEKEKAEKVKQEELAKKKEEERKKREEEERAKKEEEDRLEKEKAEKLKQEEERKKQEEEEHARKEKAAKLEKEKMAQEKEKAAHEKKKEEEETLVKEKEAAEEIKNKELERQQKEIAEKLKEEEEEEDNAKEVKLKLQQDPEADKAKNKEEKRLKKEQSKTDSRRSSKNEEIKNESKRLKKKDSKEETPRTSLKDETKDETKKVKKEDSKDDSKESPRVSKKESSKEGSRRSSKSEDPQNKVKRLKKESSKEGSRRSSKKDDATLECERPRPEDSKKESKPSKSEKSEEVSGRLKPEVSDEKPPSDKTQSIPVAKKKEDEEDEEKTPINSEVEIREKSKQKICSKKETSYDQDPRSTSTIRTDSEMDSEYSECSKSAIPRESLSAKNRRRRSDLQTEIDKESLSKSRKFVGETHEETFSPEDKYHTPHYSASSRIHEFTPGPRDRGKKPSFCTKLTDRTAAEGSRIKLTCTVLGNPEPQIYWTKNGKEIPSSSNRHCTIDEDGILSLQFYSASPKDSGEYSCVATNVHGQAYTEAKLKVYGGYEPSPALPTFTRSIKDTYRSAENELILECRVRGQPSPKITWLKDGQILQISDRYQQADLGDGICRLKISHPDFYDSGLYTCRAENNSKISDCTSHVVNFDKKANERVASWRGSCHNLTSSEKDTGRPRFSSYLTDHSVPAGGTIALQVEVKGVPAPDITWLRGDRKEPISAYKARTFADSGVYTLIVPEATESETGTYICRASNSYGYVDTAANVEVISSSPGDGGKPAMFVSRPAETMIHVTTGEDVSVSFRVTGVPKPRIVWMKGLRDITNGPRSYKESSDDYVRLTLKRALVSDEGTYCIMAKNRYGCDRTFYTVKVKQRARSLTPSDWGTIDTDNLLTNIHDTERSYLKQVPGAITSEPVVVDGGRNWLALSWGKAVQHGPAPVVAYRVDAWLLGGEGGARWVELGVTPVNAFDAFNLRPGGEYKFRITPRNRYGWGETFTMTNSVTVREIVKFPEFSKILTGQLKALRGETLRLECEVRSDSKAEVKWYRDTTDIDDIRDPRYMTHYNGSKCTMVVQSIKENDSGRYVCEATNPAGRVSTFVRVQVITDPKIVEADEKLRRMRTLESSNEERPPEFTMRLRDRRVQMTYPVRLTCQVSGHPEPEVTWYKNREEIFQDDNISFWDDESHFHTLEISHSTVEDSGVYMAKARNFNGSVSCRCHLVVDKGIRAYVAPEFFRHLDAVYTVKAGGELRMTAQIEAYPTVGIVWHRDGHRLRPSRSAVMTLNHDGSVELSLAHVTSRDSGLYCCTATNEVGQTESTTRVSVIGSTDDDIPSITQSLPETVESIDVPYSKEPVFVTKPLSTEAIEGDTVIILCEVVGDPKPEVIWLRDFLRPDYYRDAPHFRRVGAGPQYRLEIPYAKLDFTGAYSPDYYRDAPHFRRVGAGPQYRLEIPYAKLDFTGAYSVIAKNCHGEAKAIISLQIYARGQGKGDSTMEQSTIKHGKVQTLPSIKRPLRDLRCCDGDAVTLICKIHATPQPDIRWEKSGKLLPLGGDFVADFDGETARLSIQHVYPEDEGEYTCVAYNDLGKAFTSACLIVDVPEGKESAISRRLIKPIGLLSAESTPISTPRSTPIRSLSPACIGSRRELKPVTRTPRGQSSGRRPRLPVGPKFYAVPHNRVAEEGETVRFQCAIAGHPTPWVTWDKDGIPVTPTARISLKEKDDVRILEITEINHEDAGLYRITLENDVGKTEATARLEIIKGRHGSVTRTIRTRSASPRTYSIYSRSPVTSAWRGETHLRPDSHESVISGRGGTLSPTLPRWRYRNGKPSMESLEVIRKINKQTRTRANNNLRQQKKSVKDSVSEKAPSSSEPKTNSNAKEISTKPENSRILKNPSNKKETKNENIRSNKNSRTKTTSNGSMIPKRLESRSRTPILKIDKKNKPEEPEVKKEEIDAVKENDEMILLALPKKEEEKESLKNQSQIENHEFIIEETKEARQPIILAAPADMTVLRGSKVIFLATFDGEPQPRVKWLRKGRDVRLDDNAEIETSRGMTCLTLKGVTTEQNGKYAVTLENIAGRDCRYVNLTVEGVPDPPAGKPCVQSITRTGKAIVTWRSPSYDGGCAVTGYSVEMKREDEPSWIGIAEARHSLSHTVTGLVPEDTYRFRVRAENAHGVSEPSAVSDIVIVPGENDEEIGGQVFTAEINQIENDEDEEKFEPAFEPRNVILEDGRHFGERYNVMEELGKGRYGIVKRIIEKSTAAEFAAKFVRTIKAKDRQQVYDEINIMNRLRHPKLLRLAAAFENPKEIIMVTEYISGGELFERVVADDFTLTEKDSILFVKQICEGVEYMHANNVVHLDLKPENIMCHTRTSHRIKLIDFGLAQTLNPDTPVRVLFGTPEFIPPEIIGFEPIGTESDMWSVGVICYVLLTGLSPFMGDNDAETFANITRADFDFDDKAFTAISTEAKDFISALLVKRKEQRMSAKQCLEHPWLAQHTGSMSRVPLPTDKLKKFIVRRKWQKTGNAIRALGRMAVLSANSRRNVSTDSSPTRVDSGEESFEETMEKSVNFEDIKPVIVIDDKESNENLKKCKTNEEKILNNDENESVDELTEVVETSHVLEPEMGDDDISRDEIIAEENIITVTEIEENEEAETMDEKYSLFVEEMDQLLKVEDIPETESISIEEITSETLDESTNPDSEKKDVFNSFVNLEITESGTVESKENNPAEERGENLQQDENHSGDKEVEEEPETGMGKIETLIDNEENCAGPEVDTISCVPEASSKTNDSVLVDEENEIARITGRGRTRPFVRTGSVSRTAKMFEKEDEKRQQQNPINRTHPIVPETRPQNERIRKAFAFWNK